MKLIGEKRQLVACQCGCGQIYPILRGDFAFAEDRQFSCLIGLLEHGKGNGHAWFAFKTGPWFEDDQRGCMVTIHGRLAGSEVIFTIESESHPWLVEDVAECRMITREEVTAKDAKKWLFGSVDRLVDNHDEVRAFLQSHAAQQRVPADGPASRARG